MASTKSFALLLAVIVSQFIAASAQCNPLKGSCPPTPGFVDEYSVDFTKINSLPSEWILANYENVSFSSNGIEFTLVKQGDSPYIWTNQYLQYGYVEVVLETAPGIGVISSAVLLSDDLDEIDWEFSGNDFGNTVPTLQTNYYGKGITGDYDRGTQPHISGNMTTQFHTYVLNWTPESLSWYVNGQNIRTLYAKDCDNSTHQYPQTPARFHLGVWDAGDPSVAAGTVEWAGGYTNMNGFPYSMTVQSVSIVPQNQCLWYNYTDTSGSGDSVQCIGTNLVTSSTSTTSSSSSTSLPWLPPPTTTDTSLVVSVTSEMTSTPSLSASSSSSGSFPSSVAATISTSSAVASSTLQGSSAHTGLSSTSNSQSSSVGTASGSTAPSTTANVYPSASASASSSSVATSSASVAASSPAIDYGRGSSASASTASGAPSTSSTHYPNNYGESSSITDTSSNQGHSTSASQSSASASSSQANSVVASTTCTSRTMSSQGQSTSQSPKKTPCYHDNCLRNLLDIRYSADAKNFCGMTTATPKAVPPMFEGCRDGVAVQSACSCFMGMLPASSTTSVTSSTPIAQQKEGGLGGFVKELMNLW